MERHIFQSPKAAPADGYAPAVAVTGASRLIFLSGQVPVAKDGTVPAGIEAQTRQVWAHIFDLLAEADMTPDNLVKVCVYLSDRNLRSLVNAVSDEIMRGRLVAWTTIIAGMIDDDWLLEIEAVAAA